MSWTDEEIDNLFKDGANAQSFKYDNSYFAEMEAASLPVNKKGKDFLWMGTALLFIAVLTTGYFVNNTNDTSFNTENNQLANLELNNTTNENTNNSSASNETSLSNGDQNESLNNADNAESNDLNDQLLSSESSSSASDKNSSYTAAQLKSQATNYQNSSYAASQKNAQANSMYNIATRNVGASRMNDVNQKNNQSGLADANGTQTGADQGSINGSSVDPRDTKVNDQKQFMLQAAPITASLNVNGADQLNNGLSQNLAPNAIPLGLGLLRPKAAFYVELNAGVSQSLITPSDLMSKSVGGGIGVESYFGNFNLTTGLNFKASYHDDLFLTRAGKVYHFGSNEGINSYDVEKIYSIEIPIALGYNFGKHNLNLGLRPSLVVSTGTQVYTYEDEIPLRSGYHHGFLVEEVEVQDELINEEIDAIKRFGLKPTIGYSYRMNNWTIGANVGVQLMQSVDEDLFDLTNSQLPIDGQIYLRRTIRLRK